MSRLRSNCSVIWVEPSELLEVISVTPAMWPNSRSSGVAMDDATISGLAPGRLALTEIVGESTSGSGETGREKNASVPASATPSVSSVVATGRWMNGSEMLMAVSAEIPIPYPVGAKLPIPTPTGLFHIAQGCAAALPWVTRPSVPTLKGLNRLFRRPGMTQPLQG